MEKVPAFQIQVIVEVLETVNILLYLASKFLCVIICIHEIPFEVIYKCVCKNRNADRSYIFGMVYHCFKS